MKIHFQPYLDTGQTVHQTCVLEVNEYSAQSHAKRYNRVIK